MLYRLAKPTNCSSFLLSSLAACCVHSVDRFLCARNLTGRLADTEVAAGKRKCLFCSWFLFNSQKAVSNSCSKKLTTQSRPKCGKKRKTAEAKFFLERRTNPPSQTVFPGIEKKSPGQGGMKNRGKRGEEKRGRHKRGTHNVQCGRTACRQLFT